MKTNSIISNMIPKGNGSTRNVILNLLHNWSTSGLAEVVREYTVFTWNTY